MSEMIKIAVDAMGGDGSPKKVIDGIILNHQSNKNNFFKKNHSTSEKELLIEMLFQLGAKGVSKFKKMLYFLNKKQKFMASLEMLDSLWYLQTPERVKNLIKNYTKK